jgi:beta-galactosidase/beta-glucuronidase
MPACLARGADAGHGRQCLAQRTQSARPGLLDICDATGMMMIAETRLNTTNPEALDELERMILSSRNHPAIILWSVGNEEGHQGTERGRACPPSSWRAASSSIPRG